MSSGTVTNYSREDTRRVDWVIGVEYGENYDKVESTVRRIISEDSRILNTPEPFVALHALDASSVNVVIRVWVKSGDYWGVYFDMNKKIYSVFNEEGIDFPFPQLTVASGERLSGLQVSIYWLSATISYGLQVYCIIILQDTCSP